MKELTEYTAWALAEGIRAGTFTAQEVAQAHLAQIAAAEPQVAAFLTVTAERALAAAGQIDARRAAGGPLPPLAGVPMGVKDKMCIRDSGRNRPGKSGRKACPNRPRAGCRRYWPPPKKRPAPGGRPAADVYKRQQESCTIF